MADDALLALDMGGDIELPGVPAGQLPPVLEQIIGTNDIVDHAVIHALVRAGRSVARIVAFSVDKFYEVEPDKRPAAWAEAVANDELIEGYGTGWILGSERRVLVTNNHVLPLPEAAQGATIEFGFERSLNRSPRPQFVLRLDPDELFITDPNMSFGGLDYTVVALSRQAPADLGFLEPVKNRTAENARSIFIVQHPGGEGKSYVFNHNRLVNLPPRYLTYVSDTLRGSSGSPLFDDSIRLVGIHHLGGYRAKVGAKTEITNLGSRMEVVVDDIAAKLNALPEWDDARIQHYFGEGVVLDAWRSLQE